LLHHYERLMLLVICGFLLASLWVVWPFQERHFVLVRGKERLLESTPVLPSLDSVAAQSFALTLVGIVVVVGAMAISKHQRSAAATGSFP
jgi:hypothetical protein